MLIVLRINRLPGFCENVVVLVRGRSSVRIAEETVTYCAIHIEHEHVCNQGDQTDSVVTKARTLSTFFGRLPASSNSLVHPASILQGGAGQLSKQYRQAHDQVSLLAHHACSHAWLASAEVYMRCQQLHPIALFNSIRTSSHIQCHTKLSLGIG